MNIPSPLITPCFLADRIRTEVIQSNVLTYNKLRRSKFREVSHEQLINGSRVAGDLIRTMRYRMSFDWAGIEYMHMIEGHKPNRNYQGKLTSTWLRIRYAREYPDGNIREGWKIVGAEYRDHQPGIKSRIEVVVKTLPEEN